MKPYTAADIRGWVKTLFLVVLLPCFLGCVAGGSRPTDRLSQLDKSVRSLGEIQAEHGADITAMQAELRELRGRLEELSFSSENFAKNDVGQIRQQLDSIKNRVPPPPVVPTAELDEDSSYTEGILDDSAPLFRDALSQIRQGHFEQAKETLDRAAGVQSEVSTQWRVLFWRGVVYDGLADYRSSVATYSDMVSRFPKVPRAATSLLRMAAALSKLGDSKAANLTLKKITAQYRGTEAAKQAAARLNKTY